MRIPDFVTRPLSRWAYRYMASRPVDQVIYGHDNTTVLICRWDVFDLPGFHIRLHQLVGSDEDRDLHDHPWWNVSVMVEGSYNEVKPATWYSTLFGDYMAVRRRTGDVVFRGKKSRHRIVLDDAPNAGWVFINGTAYMPAISLFIHGPNVRCWGFWDDDGHFRPAENQRRMR
jgi:hypothetical protein